MLPAGYLEHIKLRASRIEEPEDRKEAEEGRELLVAMVLTVTQDLIMAMIFLVPGLIPVLNSQVTIIAIQAEEAVLMHLHLLPIHMGLTHPMPLMTRILVGHMLI